MTEKKDLLQLRDAIDAVDQQLQTLLNQRAQLAREVGEVKTKSGDNTFYKPEREAEILLKVKQRNSGEMPTDHVARIFREIISTCLSLEQPLQIAYLGPEGTYTQTAANKHFGQAVTTKSYLSIDEIFRAVDNGSVNYGVVPIENSTGGTVTHTLDLFIRSPLIINGEVELRIQHHLMSQEQDLSAIKKVYSHQQGLLQCQQWLKTNLPDVVQEAVSSNAVAAKMAKEQKGVAAIAGEQALVLYELNSLAQNIEDDIENTTRFLIIGKQTTQACGRDKTSLLLASQNKPGSLYQLLEPLARKNISMTRIESRPSRQGIWDYLFFVDIDGHSTDPQVAEALAEIEQNAALYRILGSYPKAVL